MKIDQIEKVIKEMRETNITLTATAEKLGISRQQLRYLISVKSKRKQN